MWCKVRCRANSLIRKSQNGLQSRVVGFDSRPRFRLSCRSVLAADLRQHHILVDRHGLLLVAQTSGVQVHDFRLFVPLVEAIPAIQGLSGRARKRPGTRRSDRAYAPRAHRAWLRQQGIASRIARYSGEPCQRHGRWRWVVERTLGWVHRFRGFWIRHERRADFHQAFLLLVGSLICWH